MRKIILLAVGFITACSSPDGSFDRAQDSGLATGWQDASQPCARPEAGCPCDAGALPITCYEQPQYTPDGAMVCGIGARICEDGVWSDCGSVQSYEVESRPGTAALVDGPVECNPCNPGCSRSTDIPTASDLTADRADGLSYDPATGVGLRSTGTAMPMLPDDDGDGVPNVADECDGAGAFRAADGSCYGDEFFYHDLPFGGPVEIDPLSFGVQVRTADVYFLMDTTGSMGGEIYNLRRDLTSGSFISGCGNGIIGAIRCTIPDAWFGVGQFDDYPLNPYGSAAYGDTVYRNLLDITSSTSTAQTAVNTLATHNGWDIPESNAQALWAVATGGGLGPYLSERTDCSSGRWGYPCFRDGTIPIVIMFTDAPFHNGPNTSYDYGSLGSSGGGLPSATSISNSNQRFSSAYSIGDLTSRWVGFSSTTSGASNDYTSSCGGYWSNDVVYRFTLSSRTNIRVSLEGSSFDTVVSLHRADSSYSQITCNDDYSGLGRVSRIDRTLDPGTYYVVVQGYYFSSRGAYRLSIGNPSASSGGGSYPVSWGDTVRELNDEGIRVITVYSGSSAGYNDARALADATGSYTSSGARAVFPISGSGAGLSTAVVDAVVDLAEYSRMDVTARATDDPATAIDERRFVAGYDAIGWGPGSCAATRSDGFVQCLPGTNLDFQVRFRNDFVMPTSTPQVFSFFIEVMGDSLYVLERVPVRIVVPPETATFPPMGRYWRDYDSTAYCTLTELPDWQTFSWNVTDVPAGTRIEWSFSTAETGAGLDTAAPVTMVTAPAPSSDWSGSMDLGQFFVDNARYNGMSFVRVTATFHSNTAMTATPRLHSFSLTYGCRPGS